jgi:hypothetical protein
VQYALRGVLETVCDQFRRWADDGTSQSIVDALQGELDAEDRIDCEQFNVDGTTV